MTYRNERLDRALLAMKVEAQRALKKHGPENTMDAPGRLDGDRLAILVEEVGEVAHELTYDQGVKIESIPGFRWLPGSWHPIEIKFESWSDGESFVTAVYPDYGGTVRTRVKEVSDEQLAAWGYRRTTTRQRLRAELVQVGAMAATWIAAIDAKEEGV